MSQNIDLRQHPHQLRRASELWTARMAALPYAAATEAKNLSACVIGAFAGRSFRAVAEIRVFEPVGATLRDPEHYRLTAQTIFPWRFAGRAAHFLRMLIGLRRTAAYGHGILEDLQQGRCCIQHQRDFAAGGQPLG
jgi:hypothetical protein